MKYHIGVGGNVTACTAHYRSCPLGDQHYDTKDEAREAYEQMNTLICKRGEWVREGQVGVSSFLREVVARAGANERYSGTWDQLVNLTKQHMNQAEPGTGSSGDVLLVPVPAKNFFTTIVEITEENRDQVQQRWESRVEGEKPVMKQVIVGAPVPAHTVNIVIYRADLLAQDQDRSTDDEWEIVAINAQPADNVPMHPTTMQRNAGNEKGGTLRVYSEEEWARSRAYWDHHAYAVSE